MDRALERSVGERLLLGAAAIQMSTSSTFRLPEYADEPVLCERRCRLTACLKGRASRRVHDAQIQGDADIDSS